MSTNETRKRHTGHEQYERVSKDHRRGRDQEEPRRSVADRSVENGPHNRKAQEGFAREQTRINQIQEAEQMREWVSKEDEFVLKQSKKKAQIRVREGRAKTIDWLAVTLSTIDPTRDLLEEDEMEPDVEVIDPSAVFEGLDLPSLKDLERDIETYKSLETNNKNRRYWSALGVICMDYKDKLAPAAAHTNRRSTDSVSVDIERLLGPKTLVDLEGLERQIMTKLRSNEPIDVEYWENLLSSVGVYKARAELKAVYSSIVQSRLSALRIEEQAQAADSSNKLSLLLGNTEAFASPDDTALLCRSTNIEPEPMLRLQADDKGLEILDESHFVERIATERRRVLGLRFVPRRQGNPHKSNVTAVSSVTQGSSTEPTRFAPLAVEDFSAATTALYEREVARGVQEDEEIFAGEETVSTKSQSQWAGKYRPRKPRYFNRVQMGYEWNKYNQTHYDHDNPPPKVVQGYKFNVFYPELIDKAKAPTYKIERENGRKRGETFAPAGEEDTCLIRFISGPPYEDLGFKIIDKEWDFSAKRERGFRSSFDKGILQLHFQFKKVFYRK